MSMRSPSVENRHFFSAGGRAFQSALLVLPPPGHPNTPRPSRQHGFPLASHGRGEGAWPSTTSGPQAPMARPPKGRSSQRPRPGGTVSFSSHFISIKRELFNLNTKESFNLNKKVFFFPLLRDPAFSSMRIEEISLHPYFRVRGHSVLYTVVARTLCPPGTLPRLLSRKYTHLYIHRAICPGSARGWGGALSILYRAFHAHLVALPGLQQISAFLAFSA